MRTLEEQKIFRYTHVWRRRELVWMRRSFRMVWRLGVTVLRCVLEPPRMYKHNDQTGRYEEFDTRGERPRGPPPRAF